MIGRREAVTVDMFVSNCDGCIYDVTGRTDLDNDEFCAIIGVCATCKRGLIGEYAKKAPDLYKSKEQCERGGLFCKRK